MTTKRFSQMSTAKLNALMTTASDEDKLAIQEVLDKRAAVNTGDVPADTMAQGPTVVEVEPEEELTDEEKKAIEMAEENGGRLDNGTQGRKKKEKMTLEQLHDLAESLKDNIGRKCQVVPQNTIEYVNGYIVGVTEEKRSCKAFYNIKLEDGRRVVKAYDHPLLKILDEKIEVKTRAASTHKTRKDMTEEEIEAIKADMTTNIGKVVSFKLFGKDDVTSGRIVGVVVDRRGPTFLYKIKYDITQEDGTVIAKTVHKTYNSDDLDIVADFDEIGLAMQNKRANREASMTSAEKLERAKADLKKAEDVLARMQERIAELKAKIEKLEAENDNTEEPVNGTDNADTSTQESEDLA